MDNVYFTLETSKYCTKIHQKIKQCLKTYMFAKISFREIFGRGQFAEKMSS